MARVEAAASLHVVVAVSLAAGHVEQVELELPAGSLVIDAVLVSGLAARHPQLDFGALRTAVWGVARPLEYRLRDRDRVELLRDLKVDPKEARRLRYRSQRGER